MIRVCVILVRRSKNAGVAQLVEQLICNQQVGGSSPSTSSNPLKFNMGEFPSGQRGQTVNLLLSASMVRIHPLPPNKKRLASASLFLFGGMKRFLTGTLSSLRL